MSIRQVMNPLGDYPYFIMLFLVVVVVLLILFLSRSNNTQGSLIEIQAEVPDSIVCSMVDSLCAEGLEGKFFRFRYTSAVFGGDTVHFDTTVWYRVVCGMTEDFFDVEGFGE